MGAADRAAVRLGLLLHSYGLHILPLFVSAHYLFYNYGSQLHQIPASRLCAQDGLNIYLAHNGYYFDPTRTARKHSYFNNGLLFLSKAVRK